MSIRIITDSGCDISQKEAKEKGIVVLPLTTIINQKEYRANHFTSDNWSVLRCV